MESEEEKGETIYGSMGTLESDSHVMSERVQSLAASIYQEFERMIKKYDEDVVKALMPLVVGILENLDQSFLDKQENEVEVELLRDDNEQLLTQYEREKQLRKAAEQKLLEIEDQSEEERKEMTSKVESLESISRMLELKGKNAQDHVTRLEEKEGEMKKEYNKLHERYTELFKTHMDYMERTKMLMGTDRLADMGISPKVRGGLALPNLRHVFPATPGSVSGDTPKSGSSPPFSITSPMKGPDNSQNLQNELNVDKNRNQRGVTQVTDCGQVTDTVQVTESGTKNAEEISTTTTPSISVNLNEPSDNNKTVEVKDSKSDSAILSRKVSDTVNEIAELRKNTLEVPSRDGASFQDSFELSMTPPAMKSQLGMHQALNDIVASTPELDDYEPFNKSKSAPVGMPGTSSNEPSVFDELTFHGQEFIGDIDEGADITASDNFFGMGKEVENLIQENAELLATKNALNIVKDDLIAKVDEFTSEQEILREEINSLQTVKSRMKLRITELEEELKKFKEELDKKNQQLNNDDDDEIPMAQRKRFTRVEMARVLMERNQYKERLMELQEAVRWTEMIRASREHPDLATANNSKKKSSIWNFFSNLFSSSSKPPGSAKRSSQTAMVRYNAPTTHVQPVGDPNKKNRKNYKLGDKEKAYDFLQEEALNEKAKKHRENERREQYKQVRAHVKKDDGRMQAYGWSLPAKFQPLSLRDPSGGNKSHVPVPVPVYCRPLLEKDPGMKIWCAAGVNLTGGRTRDGGSIVGASVFYSEPPESETTDKPPETEIDKLDKELKDHEENVREEDDQHMSSFVWIVTSTHASSRVTVIDANNPADVLESFHVSSTHILCITSVPGAKESDYPIEEPVIPDPDINLQASPVKQSNTTPTEESTNIGGITFVQCATGGASHSTTPVSGSPTGSLTRSKDGSQIKATVIRATGEPASSGKTSPTAISPDEKRLLNEPSDVVRDGIYGVEDNVLVSEVEKMSSSVLPTMWLGSQSGSLYVHSAVSHWRRCLHSVKLKDSVLHIVSVKGRVLAALADGTVAIFHRATDGQWDLTNYHLLDLGRPHHSIRCMTIVANKYVWCGYRNKIHVVDPKTMKLEKSFDAHPRKESQVRQMAWVGDGVWVSIRLDSTLRLYHAYTQEHLQDVDIEPYVSKMLGTGKLGFSFVRITSLLISCNRLWIGTGNGVIISVPLSEGNKVPVNASGTAGKPGGVIRVYGDAASDSVTPGTFIPYCTMAQAQLSFHGHRDAVKFFAAVPGPLAKGISSASISSSTDDKNNLLSSRKTKLVISGGEGYIDFRIGDGDEDETTIVGVDEERKCNIGRADRSHLIVWQVSAPS